MCIAGQNFYCIRPSGSSGCFIGGIERTVCGNGPYSKTRKCNVAGKNCNYCDVSNPDMNASKDIRVKLGAWCSSQGGNLQDQAPSLTNLNMPDCW